MKNREINRMRKSGNTISELRQEIDCIDERLAKVLLERQDIMIRIKDVKKSQGLDPRDYARESEILERLKRAVPGLQADLLVSVYENLFLFANHHSQDMPSTSEKKGILEILDHNPIIIAGPCSVESKSHISEMAKIMNNLGVRLIRGGAFKPRTSPKDFQGLGGQGLGYLRQAADANNLYTVSEIMDVNQLEEFGSLVDVIQIGSRNMTSYAFLKEVGKATAKNQKPVLLKRGMSATISEFLNAAQYISQEGNQNMLLCLRGIRTFEQIDSSFRNTPDLADILEIKQRCGYKVLFDPSHSAGDAKYVPALCRAAMSLGADGLIIECHNHPENALVDGKQSITPSVLYKIISDIRRQ